MKEIGGYFELELAQKEEYHKSAIKLNSGRNTFKYILKAQNIKKVFIPVFICNSVIEPLLELNIKYEFYNINKHFEIIQNIQIQENEKLLYVNYFALKSEYINHLVSKYNDKLIIDNTQAFFEIPINFIDTIYAPRKFFGVSDGGYLYTNHFMNEKLEKDESYKYSSQLIGRIDTNASSFYIEYQKAEQRLRNQPIKIMSNFTSKLLSSIDYEHAKLIRKRNFSYLHTQLKDINLLMINMSLFSTPFVYPLMIENENLRAKLILNKIYTAKYWNEVLERKNVNNIEKDFVEQIIPLPIDQRYDIKDMQRIIKIIKRNL